MRVREIAEEGDERWAGGTTPWETGGMAGRLRDCLGSEREEATTSVLSPSVISRGLALLERVWASPIRRLACAVVLLYRCWLVSVRCRKWCGHF